MLLAGLAVVGASVTPVIISGTLVARSSELPVVAILVGLPVALVSESVTLSVGPALEL